MHKLNKRCKNQPDNWQGNYWICGECCGEMRNWPLNPGIYGSICFNDIPCNGKTGYVCEYSTKFFYYFNFDNVYLFIFI